MNVVVIFLCICMILVVVPHRCHTEQAPPIVDIEMSEAGFHRDLVYTVQFDHPVAGKECEYILAQPLPAAVYVSVDQMNDLKRLRKLNAIYPQFVDIEIPTEKATALTVLLKGTPKAADTIKLPIHFRYHAPQDKSTYVTVDIATPTMYMNCPDKDSDLFYNELPTISSAKYCLQEHAKSLTLYSNDNSGTLLPAECNWKLVGVNYQLKSPLRAKIPVGNEKSFPPILYATIIVSWIVSLWTIFSTHNVPRRINQKLQEQRVLQNKMK